MWGYSNNNSLDTGIVRNAEIYQWNIGVQHLFPAGITIGADYSASRSTHLPYSSSSGAAEHNFLPSAMRNQIVAHYNACVATGSSNCVAPSDVLGTLVPNPFQCFFTVIASPPSYCPAAPIFNEPGSLYSTDAQIPLGNLLNPFPQFNGGFDGLAPQTAHAVYNSLQVRFQKRASHYISFEGNYTLSKMMDDSSAGANSFISNAFGVGIQTLDNRKAEWSIGASDATHRMVLATIVDLPVGRGRWIGRGMNRFMDGVVGGWSVATILTFQSGTPLNITMANGRLSNGSQRPNVTCSNPSSGVSYHDAAKNGLTNFDQTASVFKQSGCFADPGDQVPGNAPRHFSNLRSDGIHNSDISFSKQFAIREHMKLQLRGEFFNFTNTPRFDQPDTAWDDGTFGAVTGTLGDPRHMQFGARFEF
jgi:hypothetical protein